MEVLSLNVVSRRGVTVGTTQLIQLDKIASPMTSVDAGANTSFVLREGKAGVSPDNPSSASSVTYVVSGNVQTIAAMSASLFYGTVTSASGRVNKNPDVRVFNIKNVCGYLKTDTNSGGVVFLYQEDSNPDLIEYIISEDVNAVNAQLVTSGTEISVIDILYADLLSLANSGGMRIGYYMITDFQTIHAISGIAANSPVYPIQIGNVEAIIVMATAPNILSDIAYSTDYPSDELKYSLIDNSLSNPDTYSLPQKKLPVTGYTSNSVTFKGVFTPSMLASGQTFSIQNSTHNNGTYTSASVSNDGTNTTVVFTVNTLNISVTDGEIWFFVDVITGGMSKGNITYRKDTVQNVSTYYDFRNVVFYHPVSAYTFSSSPSAPVTLTNISIDGVVTAIGQTFATVLLMLKYLQNTYEVYYTYNGDKKFNLFSKDGKEYGITHITDNTPTTFTITPTISRDLFYTFGNIISFTSNSGLGTFTPDDGFSVVTSTTYNVHIGKMSADVYNLNNIIFGTVTLNTFVRDVNIGDDCSYGVIANDFSYISAKSGLYNFVIKDTVKGLSIDINNNLGIVIPDAVNGMKIGDMMSNASSLINEKIDLTSLVTKINSILNPNNSNIDLPLSITGLTTLPMAGIRAAGRVNMSSSNATESINLFSGFVKNNPVKFFPASNITSMTFVHNTGANQPHCSSGANVVIDGSKGEWVEFTMMADGKIYQTGLGKYH